MTCVTMNAGTTMPVIGAGGFLLQLQMKMVWLLLKWHLRVKPAGQVFGPSWVMAWAGLDARVAPSTNPSAPRPTRKFFFVSIVSVPPSQLTTGFLIARRNGAFAGESGGTAGGPV